MSTMLFNIFNFSILEFPLFFVEIWAEEIPDEWEQKFIIFIYSRKI